MCHLQSEPEENKKDESETYTGVGQYMNCSRVSLPKVLSPGTEENGGICFIVEVVGSEDGGNKRNGTDQKRMMDYK